MKHKLIITILVLIMVGTVIASQLSISPNLTEYRDDKGTLMYTVDTSKDVKIIPTKVMSAKELIPIAINILNEKEVKSK